MPVWPTVTEGDGLGQQSADRDPVMQSYQVVVNDEEQYSIWPSNRDLPRGWTCEGTVGSKQECLAHIDRIWTDMRPLSLRKRMDEDALAGQRPEHSVGQGEAADSFGGPSIVTRLATGEHPIELSSIVGHDVGSLRDAVRQGYLLLRFTDTRGGTELGISISRELSDLSALDHDYVNGRLHVVGDLILDSQPVRCHAYIDLPSLTASGYLASKGAT